MASGEKGCSEVWDWSGIKNAYPILLKERMSLRLCVGGDESAFYIYCASMSFPYKVDLVACKIQPKPKPTMVQCNTMQYRKIKYHLR